MEFQSALSQFLSYLRLEKGLVENTLQAYHRDLVKYQAYLKSKDLTLEEVRPESIYEFLDFLAAHGIGSRCTGFPSRMPPASRCWRMPARI